MNSPTTDHTAFNDALILVARLLIGWLFLTNGWEKLMHLAGTASYLGSLGVPLPQLMVWPTMAGELLVGVTLILGLMTRCSALFAIVFTVVATALAHRYWQLPADQQSGQYIHFCKNLAIIGGLALLYVTRAGRFSVDAFRNR